MTFFDRMRTLSVENPIAFEIIAGLILCMLIYIFVLLVQYILSKYNYSNSDRPLLVQFKNGSNPRVIKQKPHLPGFINRSVNEEKGIEFSYNVWLNVNTDTWENQSKWKHVFHKGQYLPSTSKNVEPHNITPVQCPGVWIHPEQNELRVYVNSFEKHDEYITVKNFPLHKWFMLTITQVNKKTSVYVNGKHKDTMYLSSLPRQNYADFHVSQQKGFKGFMSRLEYFNFALSTSDILGLIHAGTRVMQSDYRDETSNEMSHDSSQIPYLSNRFFINEKTMDNRLLE